MDNILNYHPTKQKTIANINLKYNRYYDVLPYDDNIVKLSNNKYINASWIYDDLCIATQGPLVTTIMDFWQMIIDTKCQLIVMLTNCYDNNIEKCCQYWSFNIPNVKLINIYHLNNIILRIFIANNKIINHIQYIGWVDRGIPSSKNEIYHLIDIIDRFKGNHPFIIHCSAGVGRTGVILTLYEFYRKKTKKIDQIIYELRNQRDHMVQNIEQYNFVKSFE